MPGRNAAGLVEDAIERVIAICALWFCSSRPHTVGFDAGSASAATATPSLSWSLNCRRLAMALSAPRIGRRR